MSTIARYIAEAASEYLAGETHSTSLKTILAFHNVERANDRLRQLTGIRNFFPNSQAYADFQKVLSRSTRTMTGAREAEWGDFQTSPDLAARVCRHLSEMGVSPRVVIEPTYGAGHFILAALQEFSSIELAYGVEIQPKYEWHLKLALLRHALSQRPWSAEIELHRDDIFQHTFSSEVLRAESILIVGNPPWVTNAQLGMLNARNLPKKTNLKHLNGLDAITGKSNFDLGESILIRLLKTFSGRRGTLALLCKNSVIKNIVEALPQYAFPVSDTRSFTIDAKQAFGVSVDASLLTMELGTGSPTRVCRTFSLDQPERVLRTFGWANGKFVADIDKYRQTHTLDGRSPLIWRQGIKHDCTRIMEVEERPGLLMNGNGEPVEVEESWMYWLLKGSDLREFVVRRARKKVLITQRRIGDDTAHLRVDAPKLWRYLTQHSDLFERRKSSIYRRGPRFSIFGIGDYSFRPFKVAISGLHKQPRFSLVLPIDNRPVMLDDTCYFLGFDTYLDALFTASILNSPIVTSFLESIVFADAKRPYTKEALMRIDLLEAARRLPFDALCANWTRAGYEPQEPASDLDYAAYQHRLAERRTPEDERTQLRLNIPD